MFDGPCEIRRAGVTPDGRARLDLKAVNGSFDWSWCFSTPERTREVLAVALAAITSQRTIYCSMDEPVQSGSTVVEFGINA